MSDAEVRVFVNERGVTVPAGSRALDAVRALWPDEASAIESGRRAAEEVTARAET